MEAPVALLILGLCCAVGAQHVKFSGILQDLVDQDMDHMGITDKCEEHMLLVRDGLRDREIWALKRQYFDGANAILSQSITGIPLNPKVLNMNKTVALHNVNNIMQSVFFVLDASSHIGSDFIWGNNIFIGSPRSCSLISNPVNVRFAMDHVPVGIVNLTKITAPISVGYRSIHARHWSEMQIDLSTVEKNVLNFGFCLPLSCSNVDSFRLLTAILQNKTFVDRSLIGMNTEVIHTKILQLREDFLKNPFVTAFFIVLYTILFMTALEMGYTLTKKISAWAFASDLPNEKKQKKFFEKILSCFSIVENAKVIFSHSIGNESIEVLHGIRVFGMIMFIVGHVLLFAMSSVTNMQHSLTFAEGFWLQPLFTIHLTLDSFFVLSGMVLSYIFFQNLKKKPIRKPIMFFMRMVSSRYLRLTPPYLISMLLTVVITNLVKDLSPYYLLDDDETKCQRTWWRNLVYINNMFPMKESCMMWGWFLGADFQCFMISAALLLTFERNNKLGLSLFALVYCASSAVQGYYAYTLQFGLTLDSMHKTAHYLYSPFWSRIGAYFAGVFAGWYLSVKNRTLDLSKKWIITGWILSVTVILTMIFGHRNLEINLTFTTIYAIFARSIWGLATVWIIIACATGHGSIIDRILSAKLFLPFSRMTYSVYLVNPIWILLVTMLNEAPYTIDLPMLPVMSMGFATTIFALAFLFMMLFENPFIRLVKVFTS